MANDLRTPPGAVAIAAQILEKEAASHSQLDRFGTIVETLQRNVGYLTTLVNKVLQEKINLETESGVTLERRQF